jgi:hypothetical protein
MRANLTKAYRELRPRERFQLFERACSRKDDSDAQRLAGSAPRHLYREPDRDFVDLYLATEQITLALAIDLGPWMGWLSLSSTIASTVARPRQSEEARLRLLRLSEAATSRAAREVKSRLDAFERVARRTTGLEAGILVGTHFAPLHEALEAHGEILAAAEADPDLVASYEEQLMCLWAEAAPQLNADGDCEWE